MFRLGKLKKLKELKKLKPYALLLNIQQKRLLAITSLTTITSVHAKLQEEILIRQGKFCGKKFSGKVLGLF